MSPSRRLWVGVVAAALLASSGCHRECLVEVLIERGDLGADTVYLWASVFAVDAKTGDWLWAVDNGYEAATFFAEPGRTNRMLIHDIADDISGLHVKAYAQDANYENIGFGNTDVECSPGRVDATITMSAWECGNDIPEGNEECDGSDFWGNDCDTFGFDGGALGCSASCEWDFSGCILPPNCGNGVLDVAEDCEGTDLGGQTCEGLGANGGDLSCGPACSYDLSTCWF